MRDVIQHIELLKTKYANIPLFLFGHSMVSNKVTYNIHMYTLLSVVSIQNYIYTQWNQAFSNYICNTLRMPKVPTVAMIVYTTL